MVKSRPETPICGSLLRWVDSKEATAGCVGWLVTECREVRAVLTRETCPVKGWCSLPLIRVRRASRPGVRASIVAWKQGNACGAKGCRKVDVGLPQKRGLEPRKCPNGLSWWTSCSGTDLSGGRACWKLSKGEWAKPEVRLAEDASTSGCASLRLVSTLTVDALIKCLFQSS
jgi:hypothetical protein